MVFDYGKQSIHNSSTVIIMLPPCSSSLVSSSHSYDETITIRHPRNDAAACVRCVLHPMHLPFSSCLGCIPPLIKVGLVEVDVHGDR